MNFDNVNNAPNLLNLKKNDVLNLTKHVPSLRNVVLGAGWDAAKAGPAADLDISAFLLNENGKIANTATDVIFFNHLESTGIRLEGDNRTGEGDGDDERIDIDLSKIPSHIKRIVFFVTIYEAQNKRQTFGMVENSYVRLLNDDNNMEEICKYPLKENFSTETAITFAELFRESLPSGECWSFKAIGDGSIADLNGLLSKYC